MLITGRVFSVDFKKLSMCYLLHNARKDMYMISFPSIRNRDAYVYLQLFPTFYSLESLTVGDLVTGNVTAFFVV